ncbi:MAG: hypothetical protein IJF54_00635 [Clostridia bacterium]|nr:hypothetical protein [Clostridia bacterium]
MNNSNFCDESALEDAKSSIKNIRLELETEIQNNNHKILIYCIDTLLEIMNEGNRRKTFDFANAIHNMPEICMGTRDIDSFKPEINYYNCKNEEQRFSDYLDFEDNCFITETDERYVKHQFYKSTVIAFVIFSLLACFGFLVAWQTFVFFEVIVLISCIVTIFSKKREGHNYELHFENDWLLITNCVTFDSYEVYDVPASDFVITQSNKEKESDYCSLLIKNTVFAFGGVKKCNKLKEYISNNFR